MVLEQGRLQEMDSPQNLLADRDTAFYRMARQARLLMRCVRYHYYVKAGNTAGGRRAGGLFKKSQDSNNDNSNNNSPTTTNQTTNQHASPWQAPGTTRIEPWTRRRKTHRPAPRRRQAAAEEGEGEGLPDGGWGWMVVLASLVCNIVVDGVCYSFGVFQEKYMEEFKATNEQTSWVGSLLAGCYLTVGPVVSVLAERFGSRKVTIAGSVIACFGFLLSTQATSIEMLIVTWGVIGGVGFGMIYLPAIVTVGHWFDKKRAFATGLAVCGTGVGTFIFAPLSQRLVQEFEWRGAHLIIAGIVLNCMVCGVVFRPLDKVKKPRRECYQSQVEIQRGAIMKALIEEKKRQRTISNGSLDNCIITRDNRLIKVDPALLDPKRRNSFIARFKRSLGFSSQSLNKSKSSLNAIPSIVIDAVNEAQKESNGSKLSPIYRPSSSSPPSSSLGRKDLPTKSEASDDSGVCSDGQKPPSESVSLNEILSRLAAEGRVAGVEAGSNASLNGSAVGGMDASIISVQVLQHYNNAAAAADSSTAAGSWRRRSTRSESGSYTNPVISSSSLSSVPCSYLSIPQQLSQCSLETIAAAAEVEEKERSRGTVMRMVFVLRDMIDVNLLKSPMFSLLVVASVLTLLAFFIPFFYITKKAENIGMHDDEAVFLLSIIGITNTIGRVISGWIADRPWTNVLHLNNGALVVAGVGTILVAFCQTFSMLCVYAATFGFCVAVFVSLRSILLVDLLGIELLTKSFGILILFQGIATMVGAPLAGHLLDTTGSVNNCFIMAGVLLLVSGLMGIPLWLLKRRQTSRTLPPLLPEQMPFNGTVPSQPAHALANEEG
ncbi:monocarboxylate transporter 5-like [Babylonia areolata]|uniref:monocarboxylate transporter 5-like n=1 Tax=Babylonia areolata TaxID=304850 RepID=UPI003FD0868D